MSDHRNGDPEPRHLGLSRRSAGTIMVVIAYVGVISALVGAVVGWQFLGELSDANKQGLELAEESLTAADAVVGRRRRHRRCGRRFARRAEFDHHDGRRRDRRDDRGRRVDGRTRGGAARHARSVDNGLASIATIAGTIDNTLSQLSRIPLAPDYDPDVTLSDAIGNLRGDIAPLGRRRACGVRRPRHVLGAAATTSKASWPIWRRASRRCRWRSVARRTSSPQARTSTDAALALAQTTLSDIGNQLALTRLLLVIVAIAIAIGQIVPYWVGRELRDAPVVVVADASELSDIEVTQLHPDPA